MDLIRARARAEQMIESTARVARRSWPLVVLFLFAAYYCHRFYGVQFSLRGDAALNSYFRLHEEIVRADHNPHQLHYMTHWIPHYGLYNPVLRAAVVLVRLLGADLPAAAQGLFANMLTAFLLLYLLAGSSWWFLRAGGLGNPAALLGSVVVSFTGFHTTTGVGEFDLFYLASFAAVPWTLLCFLKLCEGTQRLRFACGAAMAIGLSLLAGTDVPLFYYLPFSFALPFLDWLRQKRLGRSARLLAFQVLALLLGAAIALPLLVPGHLSLSETVRQNTSFTWDGNMASPREILFTLLFRDWWPGGGSGAYHERDFFVGLPVVALAVVGLGACRFRREPDPRRALWDRFMLLLLVAGGTLCLFSVLPRFLQDAIAWFSLRLSIRFPNRFFMLVLLPLGYFAGRGLEQAARRRVLPVAATLFVAAVAIAWWEVRPGLANLGRDTQVALIACWTFALPATLLCALAGTVERIRNGVVFLVFGMYAFAQPRLPPTPLDFLGLRWNYASAAKEATRELTEPPALLRDPATRNGRLFIKTESVSIHRLLFAASTGHKIALDYAFDPAFPRRLQDLVALGNPALHDLVGVCWIFELADEEALQRDSVIRPEALVRAPGCLPEAFVGWRWLRLESDQAVERWMAQADTATLARDVAVDCAEGACSGLPADPTGEPPAHRRGVTVRVGDPGRMVFDLAAGPGQVLFVSTAYRGDWQASVDGAPASVVRADHAFMGVPVPPTACRVELVLKPPYRREAQAIGMLALGLCSIGITGALRRHSRGKVPST